MAGRTSLAKRVLRKSGLTATVKWGMNVYTHNGKNIVGVAGFKNFFHTMVLQCVFPKG